jgi:hypothetical protein
MKNFVAAIEDYNKAQKYYPPFSMEIANLYYNRGLAGLANNDIMGAKMDLNTASQRGIIQASDLLKKM